MTRFTRYAVYYLPDNDNLAGFGASWLGWDIRAGKPCSQPAVEGIETFTRKPRKYGFHGTLKPPFRLARGLTEPELIAAVELLAAHRPAPTVDALIPASIGPFLALVPAGNSRALADLAFACVTELDRFRHPLDSEELNRRRRKSLTERQEDMLQQWGYPFVGDDFHFHLTLTGPLPAAERPRVLSAIELHLPVIPKPFRIASIALVGEAEDGYFRLIKRLPLSADRVP